MRRRRHGDDAVVEAFVRTEEFLLDLACRIGDERNADLMRGRLADLAAGRAVRVTGWTLINAGAVVDQDDGTAAFLLHPDGRIELADEVPA